MKIYRALCRDGVNDADAMRAQNAIDAIVEQSAALIVETILIAISERSKSNATEVETLSFPVSQPEPTE